MYTIYIYVYWTLIDKSTHLSAFRGDYSVFPYLSLLYDYFITWKTDTILSVEQLDVGLFC